MVTHEERLRGIVDSVRERFESGSFVRAGFTLRRETVTGGLQTIHFRPGYGGPDVDQGGDEWQLENSFKVDLGVRVTPKPPAEPFSSAFPAELGLDVGVGIGESKRLGFDPDFRLDTPSDSATRILELLEPFGRRWFQRYSTVERAVKALESFEPLDYPRAGTWPAAVALRLRAESGDLEGAQRNLDRLSTLHLRSTKYHQTLARFAAVYGLRATPPPCAPSGQGG